MWNSLGSSHGDLWLKGQSCFCFPLSALAELGGREGNLWVRSERSQRGQSTGAPGSRDKELMAEGVEKARNSDSVPAARPWREGVPQTHVGMVAHGALGTPRPRVDLGTAVTELSPGVATPLSGPVQCPSQHCWLWFGSARDMDEDPCWIWGPLQRVEGREILGFTSSFWTWPGQTPDEGRKEMGTALTHTQEHGAGWAQFPPQQGQEQCLLCRTNAS